MPSLDRNNGPLERAERRQRLKAAKQRCKKKWKALGSPRKGCEHVTFLAKPEKQKVTLRGRLSEPRLIAAIAIDLETGNETEVEIWSTNSAESTASSGMAVSIVGGGSEGKLKARTLVNSDCAILWTTGPRDLRRNPTETGAPRNNFFDEDWQKLAKSQDMKAMMKAWEG